jgi:DNA-binding MarR family transcriptional regulator
MTTSPTTRAQRRTAAGRAKSRPASSDRVLQDLLTNTVPSQSGAPPLPRAPSPLSRRFLHACAADVGAVFLDEEVAQLEYGSLVFLAIEPGADQRRLSEWLGVDPSKTSLIVDRIHSMGLIERRISEADRRARELFLTAKGETVWRRIYPKTKAANARVMSPLSPAEREVFLDLLIRIIEGNRAAAGPGARKRASSTHQS